MAAVTGCGAEDEEKQWLCQLDCIKLIWSPSSQQENPNWEWGRDHKNDVFEEGIKLMTKQETLSQSASLCCENQTSGVLILLYIYHLSMSLHLPSRHLFPNPLMTELWLSALGCVISKLGQLKIPHRRAQTENDLWHHVPVQGKDRNKPKGTPLEALMC